MLEEKIFNVELIKNNIIINIKNKKLIDSFNINNYNLRYVLLSFLFLYIYIIVTFCIFFFWEKKEKESRKVGLTLPMQTDQ